MAGAVEAGYANDAGVGLGQVVSLPDQASLVAAVQAGRADAAALTALSIADMASKADGRRVDQAVRRGRRQVGQGPRRLRLPQGGHGLPRRLQRRAHGLPRHARAYRAGRALRLRRRLPAEQDHRRALRRRVAPRRGGRAPPRPHRRCAMGLGTLDRDAGGRARPDRPARHPPRLRGLPAAAPAGRGADRRDHPARLRCSPSSWACSPRSPGSTAPAPVRWLATAYVEIFRGTSALVQLFWLFFVLPQFGLTLAALPRRRPRPRPQRRRLRLRGGARRHPRRRPRPVGGDDRAQHDPRRRRSAASSCRRPSSR